MESLIPRVLKSSGSTTAADTTGPAKGLVCHLDEMLDEYYKAQGWTEDGIPTQEVLDRLGLA